MSALNPRCRQHRGSSGKGNGFGALRAILEDACETIGCGLGDLTVLSAQVDPYRLDTPSGHRDGQWVAEQFDRVVKHGKKIHWRGLHYVIVVQAAQQTGCLDHNRWRFGPDFWPRSYSSPRWSEWQDLLRKREYYRIQQEKLPHQPDYFKAQIEELSQKIAAIDAENLARAQTLNAQEEPRRRALFPAAHGLFARRKDHQRAEAVLIAIYGLRTLQPVTKTDEMPAASDAAAAEDVL
jgi:hypothetical protein